MDDRLLAARDAVASRRQFIAGAAALSLLAACGDDDTTPTAAGGDDDRSDQSGSVGSELSVVRFFGPYFAAGVASRVPFGLADVDGLLPEDASPAEVTVSVTAPDGTSAATDLAAPIRTEGLPRPYYAFEFTPEAAGFYDFTVSTDDGDVISQVQIVEPGDPTFERFVGVGDAMPAVVTPTVADAAGVTPLCTLDPPCNLHDVTVEEALGEGPFVLLVATPAFCQTAVCGPVLEIMIDQIAQFPGLRFVHAEVYRDPASNSTPVDPADFAPVVDALGLPFEPVLYTVGADGVVQERLDYIFDGAEIRTAVGRLVG